MKIVLIGYGKMGKAIDTIAQERGHHIVARIDADTMVDWHRLGADVAIEFTRPEAAVSNIKKCLDHQLPVVCGTTGWYQHMHEVAQYCQEKSGSVFTASNFSLGVNLFFRLNEYLAQLMARHNNYEASITETHHTQKKDAPSGTAITLAEGMLKNLRTKNGWALHPNTDANKITIESLRVDPAPGTHTVHYKSVVDDIEITHTAHSRHGFAAGAVQVAEWITPAQGMLTMRDFLKF
jgi:4-hydroxy-tetrahydrodipicolinate reductase